MASGSVQAHPPRPLGSTSPTPHLQKKRRFLPQWGNDISAKVEAPLRNGNFVIAEVLTDA